MYDLLVPIIVILLRLTIPFSILRWPFAGAIASMLADGADIMVFEKFGIGIVGWERYHFLDKILDIYYFAFLLFVALKWQNAFARRVALFLFLWRLGGVILFEIIHWRGIFLLAPNIFENFYLAATLFMRHIPKFRFTAKRLVIILILVSIPKLIQEYIMHYIEFPTWLWIKNHLFFWMF